MMPDATLWVLLLVLLFPFSQVDAEYEQGKMNLPVIPSCPAAALLGMAPTEVTVPGSPSDLAFYVSNLTGNLTVVPDDYAAQVAPFWLLGLGRSVSYERFSRGSDPWSNSLQTATMSAASVGPSDDSLESRWMSFGLSVSPLRGSLYDPEERLSAILPELDSLLADINRGFLGKFEELCSADAELQGWYGSGDQSEEMRIRIEARESQHQDEARQVLAEDSMEVSRIKQLVSEIPVRRVGWKLDFACGWVLGFPEDDFDQGSLDRFSLWTTGGHEWSDVSLLAMVRYNRSWQDDSLSTLDFGANTSWNGPSASVISAEYLLRSRVNQDSGGEDHRATLSVTYPVLRSASVTLTLGRDFGDEANVISQLSIGVGCGSTRPLSSAPQEQ
jgi:hypothetical protein